MPERVLELMSLACFITAEMGLREQGPVHTLVSVELALESRLLPQTWGLAFYTPQSCKINLGNSSIDLAPLSTWISLFLFGVGR